MYSMNFRVVTMWEYCTGPGAYGETSGHVQWPYGWWICAWFWLEAQSNIRACEWQKEFGWDEHEVTDVFLWNRDALWRKVVAYVLVISTWRRHIHWYAFSYLPDLCWFLSKYYDSRTNKDFPPSISGDPPSLFLLVFRTPVFKSFSTPDMNVMRNSDTNQSRHVPIFVIGWWIHL